ncbi:hypothetical protein OHO28_29365 [Streptomyces europaeiscabiei]|uniref:hypothetical protein n=1 Tax=Streptomyces europaeiscabiei TaxID=146819 RepID=UPI002E19A727
MEAQTWKPLPIQYRRPRLYDWLIAGTLGILLYLEPQVPAPVPVIVAFVALRCVRHHRTV